VEGHAGLDGNRRKQNDSRSRGGFEGFFGVLQYPHGPQGIQGKVALKVTYFQASKRL
jgi:hypothetical protein